MTPPLAEPVAQETPISADIPRINGMLANLYLHPDDVRDMADQLQKLLNDFSESQRQLAAALARRKAIDEAVMPDEPERFEYSSLVPGLAIVGGLPSAVLDYVRYRDYLALRLHANALTAQLQAALSELEKSAESEMATQAKLAMTILQLAELRHVAASIEARTVERCGEAWHKAHIAWMKQNRHGTQEQADVAAVSALIAALALPVQRGEGEGKKVHVGTIGHIGSDTASLTTALLTAATTAAKGRGNG